MADDIINDSTPAPAGATFTVEKIYVKDVSFEAPGAPQVFNEQGAPELQMNLNQKVQRLSDSAFEVILGITLTCNVAGKTAYLAEVQQAGVFTLAGFEDAGIDAMLGTQCPNLLYPYAAANVTQLIQSGGFPPFFMQPINFDGLYAENLRQRAAQQAGALTGGTDLGGTETVGNA
jgi:preprotein translocase subunit SecB